MKQTWNNRFIRQLGIICLLAMIMGLGLAQVVEGQSEMTTIRYNQADLDQAWQDWQDAYLRDVSNGSQLRVNNEQNTTYSEGQAYGMLFAALFDDQVVFDRLFAYAKTYFNDHGLMEWQIRHGEIIASGAATDADVDMAMALLMACERVRDGQWSARSGGFDYCEEARAMIDAVWTYEIDKPGNQPRGGLTNNEGYELIPGDYWNLRNDYPKGIVNLSYFSPAYFRTFARFTGNDGWYDVIARNYAIARDARANSCAGFVPNWNTYAGDVQVVPWHGEKSAYWGWDAGRFAWRMALDRHWYDSSESREVLTQLGSFFANIGIYNVRTEYRLDGSLVNNYANSYFMSMAAVAIWGAPQLEPMTQCGQASGNIRTNPQQAYNAIVNRRESVYFEDSWRLLTMLLMSGQFREPFQVNTSRPTPTSDPTAMPTVQQGMPPIVNPMNDQQHGLNETVQLQVLAQDPDGGILRYLASGLPRGLRIDQASGLISGVPNAMGSYDVRVTAVDTDNMMGSITFTWTIVDSTLVAPTETALPRPTATTATTVPSHGGSGLQMALWGGNEATNQAQFRLRLQNVGQQAQSGISARFYFTVDGNHQVGDYAFDVYWDSSGVANVGEAIAVGDGIHYFPIRYDGGVLNSQGEWILQGSFHLDNWQPSIDLSNDWWRQGGFERYYAPSNHIPVYINDVLIAGSPPNGDVAIQPTPIILPATPIATTAIPTQLPPTAVIVPTQVVPTTAPSNGQLIVMSRSGEAMNEQQVQFRLRLHNQGQQAQSNLSVRLYFMPDDGHDSSHYVLDTYWDQSGAASVNGPVAAGSLFYYEINYGAATLAAGQSWEFQGNLRTADWTATLNRSNDPWAVSNLGNTFAVNDNIPIYVNGVLVAGRQP